MTNSVLFLKVWYSAFLRIKRGDFLGDTETLSFSSWCSNISCGVNPGLAKALNRSMPLVFHFPSRCLAHRPGPRRGSRNRTRLGAHALAEPQRPHAHQRHPDREKDHFSGWGLGNPPAVRWGRGCKGLPEESLGPGGLSWGWTLTFSRNSS